MSFKWTFPGSLHQMPACCGRQCSQLYLWAIMWGVELPFLHRTLLLAGHIQESCVHSESLSSRAAALCELSEEDVLRRSEWFNSSRLRYVTCPLFLKWRLLFKLNISVISVSGLLGVKCFRCFVVSCLVSGCLMTFSWLLLWVSH